MTDLIIHLVIDSREGELISLLRNREIPFSTENLELGDILFRSEEGTPVFVIERKSVADLKASICDGRLREQKARLVENMDRRRILYLIEGSMGRLLTEKIAGIPVSNLVGSLINLQLRDDLRVYKTGSIKETAEFIIKMLDKLSKDGRTFFQDGDGVSASEYSATLKTRKRDNMTPQVWLNAQLCLIPQVTERVSAEVVQLYPTVRDLIHAYDTLPDTAARKKLLANIVYPIKGDKVRRVGDKISERIFGMFYGSS